MSEFYVSVDIEADGPTPGDFSMLSLGAAAFDAGGTVLGTFAQNLEPLHGARRHQKTMDWWKTKPEAWLAATKDPVDASMAMHQFDDWVRDFMEKHGQPVFVGYPAGFDFLFVYWYLMHFIGESPFSFSALDIKTYAMASLGTEYRETTKKTMPKDWFKGLPRHSHVAVQDALEQGMLFLRMRDYNHNLRRKDREGTAQGDGEEACTKT